MPRDALTVAPRSSGGAGRAARTAEPGGSRSSRARRSARGWLIAVPGLALIALWEIAVAANVVSDRVLPPLTDVIAGIPHVVSDPSSRFFHHLGITLSEVGIGYAGAIVAGFAIGALIASSLTLRKILYPLVVVFEVIPKVALTPVLIVGLGFGVSSKAAVAGLLAFFPIFINTMSGLDYPGKEGDVLLRALGAGPLQRLRLYGIPRALPSVFAGLKVGLSMAFIGAIVAELLTLQSGLGFLINSFKGQLRMDYAYGATLLVGLIGTVLFFAVELIERRVVFWTRDASREGTL
ncbi:MAG TPA: ABC transporter permease [Conexibacter sp.]